MIERKGYNILVVDDEIEYQNVLHLILSDIGYGVTTCSNGMEALEHIEKKSVNLVITDLKMPVMDGVELIKRIKEKDDRIDVMVITAYGSIESAVDSIKYGAIDYYVKSSSMDDLVTKIDRLSRIHRLERKSSILLKNQNETEIFLDSGNGKYLELLGMCKRAADSGISILLLGESGVGKEVVANHIHGLSSRRQEPFVPINCQVFPEGVIESELFGHEKGSFTGAIEARIGKFEQANLGTLFLDEIGDLPVKTQGKLLRAIESRRIERLGSNKIIDLDVRFISATNKDLSKEILEGNFREDLYYRINTLTLEIPPLRERKEDLESLIDFFVRKTELDQKKKISRISDEVMNFLLSYDYPGNVRELRNIVERMIALSKNGEVTINDILMPIDCKNQGSSISGSIKGLKAARDNFEKAFIRDTLVHNEGNVTKAATQLKISSRQLWNKIRQYDIDVGSMNKTSH